MGTPEFPDLGKHCTVDDCRQIDFLPFTCDRCRRVFCVEHRSYTKHKCPKADYQGVTVVICPLCANGVRLNPGRDPNISWESHLKTECDPSKVTKKKKRCPVPRCRETLSFSNTIKCRDCTQDHCLKHRFGLDHNCPGPQKQDPGFSYWSILSSNRREDPKPNQAQSSSWTASFMTKLNQALQTTQNSNGHETGAKKLPVDICPKCGRGFCDAVELVEHVERDHRGASLK